MKIKLDVEKLQVGMYVAELDRPWLNSGFEFQGFEIASKQELERLQRTCQYVFVDDLKSHFQGARLARVPFLSRQTPAKKRKRREPPDAAAEGDTGKFLHSLRPAAEHRYKTKQKLYHIFNEVRMGHSVDTAEAQVLVNEMVSNISANPNTMLWLSNLKNRHEYTAEHCLNVSVLAIAFARHLDLPPVELETIGLGALLHDIGKMRTPLSVLDKPGALTQQEFEIMKRHPLDGYRILEPTRKLPECVLRIIRGHHERIDGSGYPDRLAGSGLALPVLVAAIADVYDAITSDRVYHNGMPAQDALMSMFKRAHNDFGEDLVHEFIKCVAIYPVGSLVELKNGALALVMSSDPDARLHPLLLVIRDPNGNMLTPRALVNLAALARHGASANWSIQRMLNPTDYGIDVTAIIHEELGGSPLVEADVPALRKAS
jgi:putative nucleotidyltransferase with HDIG domain